MRRAKTLEQAQATVTARLKKKRAREQVLKMRGIKPRRLVKAKKDRVEALRIQLVRALCVQRDGYCRCGKDCVRFCVGKSEWAHFGRWKRAHTRNQAPEDRHCTEGSLMLCEGCHRSYDHGDLRIRALSTDGCNGELEFRWGCD